MRFLGLDVHCDFCEVAIAETRWRVRRVRSRPAWRSLNCSRVAWRRAMSLRWRRLRTRWRSRGSSSLMSLERCWLTRRRSRPRRVTDTIDAKTLAQLLAGEFLAEVWTPDEQTRVRRQLISRRGHLVRQMVREKNQVYAVLQRQLKEQQSVNACIRQIDFVKKEIELVDVEIAKQVLASEDIRRLMTLPGVSGVIATAILAAIGDVSRFRRLAISSVSRVQPTRAPARFRACEARTHQQARPRRGPQTPGRGCLARRQNYPAAARVSSNSDAFCVSRPHPSPLRATGAALACG
jgi:Transposase/Transposase IS116/IS110/IS902 family